MIKNLGEIQTKFENLKVWGGVRIIDNLQIDNQNLQFDNLQIDHQQLTFISISVLGACHFFQFVPLWRAPPFKPLRHRTTAAFLQLN